MIINSGLNFCNCGRITFSNAARNLALPSSEASGALTMVSCSPRSPLAPVPGNNGIWCVEQYITVESDQKISCVPLPWWTSKSTTAARPMPYLRWAWRGGGGGGCQKKKKHRFFFSGGVSGGGGAGG